MERVRIDFSIKAELISNSKYKYTKLRIGKEVPEKRLEKLNALGYRLIAENQQYYYLKVIGNMIMEGLAAIC